MECNSIQQQLSEYLDNALSARETWELDKHLAECNACTRLLNELRGTVQAVADAPRFEVSADFMETLNARLAKVEPKPARWAWIENIRALFRPRVLPAW